MRRLSLALAVAALAALPASASAAGNLVVSGHAGRAAGWTTTAPVTLDLRATTVHTTKVLGLAVEDLRAHKVLSLTFDGPDLEVVPGGGLYAYDPSKRPGPASTDDQVRLAPGSYRLRLFGEGAGDVTVPVTTGEGAAVKATAPSSAQFQWTHPSPLPTSNVIRDTIPFDLAPGGRFLWVLQQHTTVWAADVSSLCVRHEGEDCTSARYGSIGPGVGVPAVGDGWIRGGFPNQYQPFTPGHWIADATWLTAGVNARVDEVFVNLRPS